MSEINDTPHIRQTIFHVNKDLKYNIDVNCTITFHYLKRMIAAAARLKKNSFRIYHDNEDLTDYEGISLEEIFPNDPVIEFNLFIEEKKEDNLTESVIKLKLNEYCSEHQAKYLSYYCYTCQMSICSLCYKTEHSDHQVIEKFDYLQPSRLLMDNLLGDENRFKTDNTVDKSQITLELKAKLKEKLFAQLHELLNEVEFKIIDVIDYFVNSVETTKVNINDNATSIKDLCAQGLDKLKDDISFDKLIIREDIYLTFDKKYKEFLMEEQRFKDDNIKYVELNNNYTPIETMIQAIYDDIFHVISKNIENQIYNDIKNNISHYLVNKISKEEIMEKIFSDIAVPRKSLLKRSCMGIPDLNSGSSKMGDNGQHNGNPADSAFGTFAPEMDKPVSQTQPTIVEALKTAIEQSSKIVEEDEPMKSKDDSNIKESSKRIRVGKICVMYPYENSNKISYEMEEGEQMEDTVEFPSLSSVKHFLENNAHCNYKNVLYISGGINPIDKKESNSVLKFDPNYKSVVMMASMTRPRTSHSMIGADNYIYAIGGYGTNTCEKFNLNTQVWEKMPSLSQGERMHPILYVNNNDLYAFFGHSKEGYLDTVERLNLKSPNAKWEIVGYKNTDDLNLKIYGSGIVGMNDQVFFFGGKTEKEIMSSVFSFMFTNNTFLECPDKVDYAIYFKETLLHPLVNNQYGNIDEVDKKALCLQVNSN